MFISRVALKPPSEIYEATTASLNLIVSKPC